jgi:hypothetical protein
MQGIIAGIGKLIPVIGIIFCVQIFVEPMGFSRLNFRVGPVVEERSGELYK